jgi:hypothetical protein
MRVKRLLTVMTILVMFISVVRQNIVIAEDAVAMKSLQSESTQVVRAAQSDRLALDFNPRTAEIVVTDLSSGASWYSNPVDRDADQLAKGVKKMDLNAQLLLDYIDPLNKPFQLNNYTGSIQEKAFTWKQIESGIEVVFGFPKAGFSIPVQYSIRDDAFTASIVTERIEQRDKYSLVNIGLLPFFGAGGIEDEGYLFVPDGSGALIRFNNNKSIYRSFNERVYGGDQAIAVSENNRMTENIQLPVFGLKRGDHAMLAVIDQGAYQAGISAEVSRKSNQYNSVYSYLNMTEFESNAVMAGSLNEKTVVRAAKSMAGGIPFKLNYYFLSGDHADYSGMAERYRKYLVEDQGVKPSAALKASSGQIPLMLDFLGGVKKRETFLGIPYQTVKVLTSLSDLEAAADKLIAAGIGNLSIYYEGWAEGGMRGKVPVSLNAESKLGGDKKFRELARKLEERGVAFYPVMDPVNFYENGHGFYKFSDAAKSISRAPTLRSEFLLSNGTKNEKIPSWYLLKPESVLEALDRFTEAAEDKHWKRVALQGISSMVYSDFRRSSLSKNETGQIWEKSLQTTAKRIPALSFDSANAYTFATAESLTGVPLFASNFDLSDETIPFYSMAVSGLIPAYSEPINLMGSTGTYLLKLIETGTFPSYRFIARDSSLLLATAYDSLYSGDFELWLEDVKQQYGQLNEALSQIMGHPMIEHEKLADGVYRSSFANGKSAVVNYSEDSITVGGERIDAGGYRIY